MRLLGWICTKGKQGRRTIMIFERWFRVYYASTRLMEKTLSDLFKWYFPANLPFIGFLNLSRHFIIPYFTRLICCVSLFPLVSVHLSVYVCRTSSLHEFLDASSHLYMRVCPSVRMSVCPFVCPLASKKNRRNCPKSSGNESYSRYI